MAQSKIAVFIKPFAERQITALSAYIEEKGYPLNAESFSEKLFDFAETLATVPLGFPVCRNAILAKQNFRCAIFRKDYIFKIIHASLLK